jgi:hypothetical protein
MTFHLRDDETGEAWVALPVILWDEGYTFFI